MVPTRSGKVRGERHHGVSVFRGIRYGADTMPRRFMPPVAPQPWHGVVDALEHGPASPQPGADEPTSEDCLFLNVWTPGAARRRRAVRCWSTSTAAPMRRAPARARCTTARGSPSAATSCVVTLNHRLNAFGYLYLDRIARTEALADSGNCGQLDLVLALEWVRDNIAAFGGDPGNVTLFGQSGGGAKIATLMAMPAAAGLFHRAVTMSGQQVTASGPLNATARTRALLARAAACRRRACRTCARCLPSACSRRCRPPTRSSAAAACTSARCWTSAPCAAIRSTRTRRRWPRACR